MHETNPETPHHPAPHVVELEELARRVDRLGPSRHDPEAFHINRSEIVAGLRRLARRWRAA